MKKSKVADSCEFLQGNSQLSQQMMRARVGFQARCYFHRLLVTLLAQTAPARYQELWSWCANWLCFVQFATVALMAGSSGYYAWQTQREDASASSDRVLGN